MDKTTESDKAPIVLPTKKKPIGRKKKEKRVLFQILNTPVVLEFK